jgi:transposase InsO family protein
VPDLDVRSFHSWGPRSRRRVGWGCRDATVGAGRRPGCTWRSKLSIAFTTRLLGAGVDPSLGSLGDAYDNALAETTIGLYKTEWINRRGPWRGLDHVEIATLEWVDSYNHRRPHQAIDDFTPVAVEGLHYAHRTALTEAGVSTT